uniref:Uncharacterized protein n=1 Tax=Meloidogyne incognita TaxID=6306 RepID=A0A914M6P7_MELIC
MHQGEGPSGSQPGGMHPGEGSRSQPRVMYQGEGSGTQQPVAEDSCDNRILQGIVPRLINDPDRTEAINNVRKQYNNLVYAYIELLANNNAIDKDINFWLKYRNQNMLDKTRPIPRPIPRFSVHFSARNDTDSKKQNPQYCPRFRP